MKTRSYATFKDGHKETIYYSKDLPNGWITFATKSGVYFYRPAPETPGVSGLKPQEFFTFYMDFCDNPTAFPELAFANDPYIRSITIDRRVEKRFKVPGYGDGTVLVDPDADASELACAIMSEMGVEIEDI